MGFPREKTRHGKRVSRPTVPDHGRRRGYVLGISPPRYEYLVYICTYEGKLGGGGHPTNVNGAWTLIGRDESPGAESGWGMGFGDDTVSGRERREVRLVLRWADAYHTQLLSATPTGAKLGLRHPVPRPRLSFCHTCGAGTPPVR